MRCSRLGLSIAVSIGLAISAVAVMGVYAPLWPMAGHMTLHILLMNLLAPLVAAAALRSGLPGGFIESGRALAIAAVSQIGLLWFAHLPGIMAWSMAGGAPAAVFPVALFLAALVFWGSVFAQRGSARWRALVALLITGKLFCLLATLLVFAPRHLYPAMLSGPHAHARLEPASLLADQQLAGLLMIAACPLTYVAVAIAITARWLREGGAADPAPARPADWN
jgi:putative membrane protein